MLDLLDMLDLLFNISNSANNHSFDSPFAEKLLSYRQARCDSRKEGCVMKMVMTPYRGLGPIHLSATITSVKKSWKTAVYNF